MRATNIARIYFKLLVGKCYYQYLGFFVRLGFRNCTKVTYPRKIHKICCYRFATLLPFFLFIDTL